MLIFKPGWNQPIPKYEEKYGEYKAFLDTLNEAAIRKAFVRAKGAFSNTWVKKFIDEALSQDPPMVTIEQGSHQPENLKSGGFCLHFTGRDSDGYAFHFYIIQDSAGNPVIFEVTYRDNGQTISDLA